MFRALLDYGFVICVKKKKIYYKSRRELFFAHSLNSIGKWINITMILTNCIVLYGEDNYVFEAKIVDVSKIEEEKKKSYYIDAFPLRRDIISNICKLNSQ